MGKTAIITGAAGNLGLAVCQRFADDGYAIEATVISDEEANQLAGIPNLSTEKINLMDETDAGQFASKVLERHGKIDALLALVGGFAPGTLAETDSPLLEKQFRLNVITAYHIVRPVFAAMKQAGGGRIVLISSKPGLAPATGKSALAYTLAKAMVANLAEILNAEGEKHGVVTAVVAPGTIDTPQNREAMPDVDFSQWVQPESLAGQIAWLCSNESKDLRRPVMRVFGGG
jgi:NAD(P)-dependent dehydrogenase (short-subunit alcohol dehydrogenase family)